MFLSPRPNYYGTWELIPLDDELLPEKFKDYLKQPENDCYRSADGIRVQIDALITFTNQFLALSCVCAVVPRSAVPNCRVGIILCRENMGINRLVYKVCPEQFSHGERVSRKQSGPLGGYLNRRIRGHRQCHPEVLVGDCVNNCQGRLRMMRSPASQVQLDLLSDYF